MTNQELESQSRSSNSFLTIELPEKCAGVYLTELASQLEESLEKYSSDNSPVLLYGSHVQSIDIFGLQLLIWFQVRAKDLGVEYSLQSSNKIVDSARVYGVSDLFPPMITSKVGE